MMFARHAAASSRSSPMASAISSVMNFTVPYGSWCMAASTAPHPVCPSTTTRLQPRWPSAYSMLPSWWLSTTLPATRMTKSSPMPAEKTASGITRESEHASTMA